MNRVTDGNIWIESDFPLANTTEWSIPLRLMKAAVEGTPANLGNVSPLLAGNLEKIRNIYADWIPSHRVPLNYEISSDTAAPGKGVSLFFSGGVDCFYSLINHMEEVESLVLIHGFDVPLADTKTFGLALGRAREVAHIYKKRLIVVRTNVFWEQPSIPCGWWMYGGAALAAVALALAPNYGKMYIASSFAYADIHPDGTHPLLDPLWSTDALQIVYDIPEARLNKLRLIIQHPEALARLRVCWENQGNYNCGLCEKCIRTMLGLRALGIDHCAAFPDTLTPKLVRRQDLGEGPVLFWREFLDAGLPPDLNSAVRSAIHSYESGLPPRTGHFKREVKRWLYAIRNAGRTLMSPIDRS